MRWACLVFLFSLLQPQVIWATGTTQPNPASVHQTQVEAIKIRQGTHKAEETWVHKKQELETHYQSLQAESKVLLSEKALLQKQIEILKGRQIEAERETTEAVLIKNGLQSHLNEVIVRLEGKIGQDLPFLMEERTDRIKRLKDTMVEPEASIAEKCRQVMEALKIETEYGQTVEVYQETILVDGPAGQQSVVADILRLGRLALFWRTPDGKSVGRWEIASSHWSTLPKKYRRAINEATEMALKRRTIEMVQLPLGRIVAQ